MPMDYGRPSSAGAAVPANPAPSTGNPNPAEPHHMPEHSLTPSPEITPAYKVPEGVGSGIGPATMGNLNPDASEDLGKETNYRDPF
jgi:hypothetical protein